jgi:multiple sugar transport system substrate-binding protein
MANQYSRRSFLAGAVATGLVSAGTTFLLPGGRSKSDSVNGEIRLWTGDDRTGARTAVIDMWNKANPDAKVEAHPVSGGSRGEHDAMVENIKNGEADVINLDIIDIREFARKGYIREISLPARTYFRAVDKVHQVAPGSGRYWAAPFNTDVGMLFSRLPAGLDFGQPLLPQVIRRDAARKPRFVGQLAPVTENHTEPFVVNVLEHALSVDPTILDDDGNVSEDLSKWRATLTPLRNAVLHQDLLRAPDQDETRMAFEAQVSFMRNWPAQSRKLKSRVDLRPLPIGILGGQSLALVAGARNVDAAIRFIEFATSLAAQQVVAAYGLAPAFPRVYDDQILAQAMPYLDQIKSALERARPRPMHSRYRDFATSLRTHVLPFLEHEDAKLTNEFIDGIKDTLDPGAR